MKLRIHGHSDDLVILTVDGRLVKDVYTSGQVRFVVEPRVGPGGVIVSMVYNDRGLWATTIVQVDEDQPIPWPVTVQHYEAQGFRGGEPVIHSYSVCVSIDIPTTGVTISAERNSREDAKIEVGEAA